MTAAYTVTCKFTGDRNFDQERSSILWEMGNHSLSFSYPYLNYSAGNVKWLIHLGGVGVKGYYYYKNKSNIEITVVYDSELDKQTIYVDGYKLAQRLVTLSPIDIPLTIKTFTGASYDKFSGTIHSIEVTNIAEYLIPLPDEKEVLRKDDFPTGYKVGSQNYEDVNSALTQLKSYIAPILTNAPHTASCINLQYMGGKDAIEMQDVLTEKYKWEIRIIDNISAFYKTKNDETTLSNRLIEYAKNKVNPFISVASSWAHLEEINGLKCANLDTITSDSPLSKFDGDRSIYETIAQAIKEKIGTMQVARHHENNEYTTGYAKKWGYVKSAEIVNYVLNNFRNILGNPPSIEYDVHSPWFYSTTVFPFKERMAINTNNMGTIQFYPRYAWNWKTWSGADRGLEFYLNSKIEEIKNGNELNTPYICFGWDNIEENNIRPAQALGLAKILKVAGSAYFYSSYFTINESGVQNPKGYVWQAAVPAYVEESVNDYQNIIMNGTLCKGDVLYNYYYKGDPVYQYNFKTGDKSIFCVARKLGDEYLIAATYQPLTNFKGQPNAKEFSITLDGVELTMNARRQGSVYYHNRSTGKLKLLDGNHKSTHFDRWETAL